MGSTGALRSGRLKAGIKLDGEDGEDGETGTLDVRATGRFALFLLRGQFRRKVLYHHQLAIVGTA